ncbi:MAG: hypothetical protein ACYCZN_16215, partial [Candidatus Dormibacteria bacterium]
MSITVSDWRPVTAGKLRGFCTATMPSGLVFREVSIFSRDDGTLTASPPARQMIGRDGVAIRGDDGKMKYQRVVEFTDGKAARAWSTGVIAA